MGPKIVWSSEDEVIKEWHDETDINDGLPDETYFDDDNNFDDSGLED